MRPKLEAEGPRLCRGGRERGPRRGSILEATGRRLEVQREVEPAKAMLRDCFLSSSNRPHDFSRKKFHLRIVVKTAMDKVSSMFYKKKEGIKLSYHQTVTLAVTCKVDDV